MRESDIQTNIMSYLRKRGFFVWKNYMSGVLIGGNRRIKNPNSGMPDICAVKDGHTFYIEVKTPIGRLSKDQIKWHDQAYKYGIIVHVVTSIEDVQSIF